MKYEFMLKYFITDLCFDKNRSLIEHNVIYFVILLKTEILMLDTKLRGNIERFSLICLRQMVARVILVNQ